METWFSIQELLGLQSLPSSDRGIMKKQTEKIGKNANVMALREELTNTPSPLSHKKPKQSFY